jgi:WD40 repeat protein
MTVCIWDVQTVTCLRRITPQGTFLALLQSMPNLSADRDITSLMWSDDAMQIVGGCADDRTMHTWSAISGDWVGTSEAGLQDSRASPDGTLCAVASGSHVPICRKGDPPLPQRIFSDTPHALSVIGVDVSDCIGLSPSNAAILHGTFNEDDTESEDGEGGLERDTF